MVTRVASSPKGARTGIAISATGLCAADLRLRGSADRAWRAPLDAPPADGGPWPSLAAALAELARTIGVTDGTLDVSLLPPLTEVRRLELPPLRDDELHRLLARNAGKYFVNARGPQLVGASGSPRRRGTASHVVAAAASARLVEAIRVAAKQAGWTIETVAPAESAWAGAAVALWPAFARQGAFAIVAHEDRTDLLQLDAGRLIAVRRFRAGPVDAPMIVDAVGPTARIGMAGAAPQRRELAAALASLGVTASPPGGEWSAFADRADLLAAHFAGAAAGPQLRGEDAVVGEKTEARRLALRVAGAAAAVLIASAAIELWGVHHQLDAVRRERARIRPQIASTMVGRTTVEAAYRHLSSLGAAERSSPLWSNVIATLSESVPDDAFLTAIRARADSIVVDGLAERAARVFDALEKTSGLADVKAASPVRRELQDDGKALEHFTIAARVLPSSVSPVATAPARRSVP